MAAVSDRIGDTGILSSHQTLVPKTAYPGLPVFDSSFDLFLGTSMAGANSQDTGLDRQVTAAYEPSDPTAPFRLGTSQFYPTLQFTLDPAKNLSNAPYGRETPSVSPSSFSQPFDQASSMVSSGASGQSTSSSVDGSPHVIATNHLPNHNKWSGSAQGQGVGPDTISHDPHTQQAYSSLSFENEMPLDDQKFQHFVGKYPTTSSDLSSTIFPSILHPKPVTIDSILEEVQRSVDKPSTSTSLCSKDGPSKATTCSTTGFPSPHVSLQCGPSASFPSSTTADSLEATSPVRLSEHGFSAQDIKQRSRTPVSYSENKSHVSQDHFFGHSSGRLVAPLESSCWFSFASVPA